MDSKGGGSDAARIELDIPEGGFPGTSEGDSSAPVHSGGVVTHSDTELGRLLLTQRGMQWLYAHGGDPYARLLVAEIEDRDAELSHGCDRLSRGRTGAWFTADPELARDILGNPRLVSRLLRQGPVFPGLPGEPGTPPAMEAAAAAAAADSVLSKLGGEFDLIADFLRPVLIGLMGDLFNVPTEDRYAFGLSCERAAATADAVLCPPPLSRARLLINAVDRLRSLLSVRTGDEGLATAMLVCVAGLEVITNLAAVTVLNLVDRETPADPAAVEGALAATLRHDPPLRIESRVAREDLRLAGEQIEAGEEVVVHLAAGPDTASLVLSGGPPYDALAPLVRTTAYAVVRALVVSRPGLRCAAPVVRRSRAPVTHAIVRFPVAT